MPPYAPRRAALTAAALLALAACSVAESGTPMPDPAASTVGAPSSASAAPSATPDPSGMPAQAPVVVLDPGHNGGNGSHPREINRLVTDGRGGTKPCNTTGTATNAGYPEHAFTWDVAVRVAETLRAKGVTVVLTRPDDDGVGPCVDVRGTAGQYADADAVVSIHADGSGPGGRGFHVAFSDPPLDPVQAGPAHDLAADLRDALSDGGFPISSYIGREGLSPRPDLAGLNLARRPAALVECANMRNADEAAVVSSPAGRARYAEAITAGILAFLQR